MTKRLEILVRAAVVVSVITAFSFGVVKSSTMGTRNGLVGNEHAKRNAGRTPALRHPTKAFRAVSSLGRLEPIGEIANISPPSTLRNERIAKVLVKRGDHVKANQVLVVMDGHSRLYAALTEANKRIEITQAQLNKVIAGAKAGELDAQRASLAFAKAEASGRMSELNSVIERLTADELFARTEASRYETLYQQGAISTSQLDSKRVALSEAAARLKEANAERTRWRETSSQRVEEAAGTLSKIEEVRTVDVDLARAELHAAQAAAERIKADIRLTEIRAPHAGQILQVYAHDGEAVGDKGLLQLGQTNSMVAVAEVFESDIRFVQKGQRAAVSGPSFEGTLGGVVMDVAPRVTKQMVSPSDPGANFDNRVVEVRVLLDPKDSKKVAGLSNLQVVVLISV